MPRQILTVKQQLGLKFEMKFFDDLVIFEKKYSTMFPIEFKQGPVAREYRKASPYAIAVAMETQKILF